MSYDKMNDFIESIYNVYNVTNNRANAIRDKRLKSIAYLIYGYVSSLAVSNNIDLKQIPTQQEINLIPFFEYVNYKNIELLNFSDVKMDDIDVSNSNDIERYILSHIYYITQK